ncbi:hypothetical protein SRHO_G00069700 [Serrasalmus rhombeus]
MVCGSLTSSDIPCLNSRNAQIHPPPTKLIIVLFILWQAPHPLFKQAALEVYVQMSTSRLKLLSLPLQP